MFYKGKRLLILIAVIFVFTCAGVVYAATAPVITSVSAPKSSSVYFANATMTPQANISNTPTTSQYKFPSNSAVRVNFTSLGGTLYGGSWTPTTSNCIYTSSSAGWAFPKGRIYASNSGGSTYKDISTYITKEPKPYYENADTSFYYISPTSNPFKATATPQASLDGQTNTYNCLAFICGNTNSWAQTPNNTATIDIYMQKIGIYSNRPGSIVYDTAYSTIQPWTDAIYYSGYHFAKVIEWDVNGNVKKIQSKWGNRESITSSCVATINPFTSVTGYGTATRFYKR